MPPRRSSSPCLWQGLLNGHFWIYVTRGGDACRCDLQQHGCQRQSPLGDGTDLHFSKECRWVGCRFGLGKTEPVEAGLLQGF